jgi:hypothetical protein
LMYYILYDFLISVVLVILFFAKKKYSTEQLTTVG